MEVISTSEEIGIVMTLHDQLSPGLKALALNTKAFDKTFDDLTQGMQTNSTAHDNLVKKAADLKKALAETNLKTKDAEKAYRELKNEASKGALDDAIEEQTRLQAELAMTKRALAENGKQYDALNKSAREYAATLNKQENAMEGGVLGSLKKAGLTKMIGDAATGLGRAGVESLVGQPIADAVNSIASGVVTGMAMGSIVPGIGMGLGAAFGAGAGVLSAATSMFSAHDSAFKSYYQEEAEAALEANKTLINSGSTLASQRESDLRGLTTLLGGWAAAENFQKSLIEIGRTPPFSYDAAMELSRDMLGLGLTARETLERLDDLGEAAAALNLSSSDVSSIVSLLESAQLAGTLDSRVVRSLSKKGINVYEALAEAFGIETSDVAGSLSSLDVDRGIQAIYDYMGERFAGASSALMNTYAGTSGILSSYDADIEAAAGQAYNDTRAEGYAKSIERKSGELGALEKTARAAMGRFQAYMDNLYDELELDARDAVMLGNISPNFQLSSQRARLEDMHREYLQLTAGADAGNEEAAYKQGMLLAEAMVIAHNEYNTSEGARLMKESELGLIANVRNDTALDTAYYDAGYQRGQAYGKGLAAALYEQVFPTLTAEDLPYGSPWEPYHSNAYGLDRVPYDGYAAILHEGERVLTAAQARERDASRAPIEITITGNSFGAGVTIEEMAAAMADAFERKLQAGVHA